MNQLKAFLTLGITLLAGTLFAQTELVIEPTQSMLITGKGPGQDATINPFKDSSCIAVITNLGAYDFSVRIQEAGKLINTITVPAESVERIEIGKNEELYFDALDGKTTKARVEYEAIEP